MPEPGPLLLERRVVTGGDLHVRRVTADGEVWVRTNIDARLEDGEWSFSRVEDPEWRREAELPPEALTALRGAIESSGFLDLPTEHHPPHAVIHGTDEVWRAELSGRAHTVTLRGVPETQVPAVTELGEALEDALSELNE